MKDRLPQADSKPLSAHRVVEPLHRFIVLERDAPHPLYLQLEEQITALILAGTVPKGATLPPERQLAESLGVSRATVQTGYNALRLRGLLGGRGRRGSVVLTENRAPMVPGMDRLKGFTQEMEEMGRVPSTRLIERSIVRDGSIAAIFGVPADTRFLHLVRLRLGDNQPLTLESAWYSLDLAPHLEAIDPYASIYASLGEAGLSLDYCDQTIETTTPGPAECALFGFGEPIACLLIKRRSHVKNGAMVEYVEGLFRGDAYIYRLRLSA